MNHNLRTPWSRRPSSPPTDVSPASATGRLVATLIDLALGPLTFLGLIITGQGSFPMLDGIPLSSTGRRASSGLPHWSSWRGGGRHPGRQSVASYGLTRRVPVLAGVRWENLPSGPPLWVSLSWPGGRWSNSCSWSPACSPT